MSIETKLKDLIEAVKKTQPPSITHSTPDANKRLTDVYYEMQTLADELNNELIYGTLYKMERNAKRESLAKQFFIAALQGPNLGGELSRKEVARQFYDMAEVMLQVADEYASNQS